MTITRTQTVSCYHVWYIWKNSKGSGFVYI